MSTRLATILGLSSDDETTAESLGLVRYREPAAGAEARTKGSLYLLAEAGDGEATAGDMVRDALAAVERSYYYDLTAGVAVTLRSAVAAASRTLRSDDEGRRGGPRAEVGIVALVVHGREAHVARVGTPTAVIVREGRMFEVAPRAGAGDRGRAGRTEPFEWHASLQRGDRIALLGRGVARAVGADELKRSLLSLRPQAAADRVTAMQRSRGGSAGALVVLEAIEVPATDPSMALEPVRPADPEAGGRDFVRLSDAVAAAATRSRRALVPVRRSLARGGAALVGVAVALVPHRRAAFPSGIPRTAQRQARRRARLGVAGLASIAIVAGFGGTTAGLRAPPPTQAIPGAAAARAATAEAVELLGRIDERVRGTDLVDRDPDAARATLADAGRALARAVAAGVDPAGVATLRARLELGLDRLDGVTRFGASDVELVVDLAAMFGEVDPADMVAASDGSLWVLDPRRGVVVRIDPATATASAVYRAGEVAAGGGVPDVPWLIATAASDVVVVDRSRVAWRIGLAEQVPRRMALEVIGSIGPGTPLIAALQHQPPLETFALYLVDRATGEVTRSVPPPVLPVSFPDPGQPYLAAAPDLDPGNARDLRVDVNAWLLHASTVTRVDFGTPRTQAEYALERPPGTGSPDPADYRILEAATRGGRELLYVYDAAAPRIVAFDRADGRFVRQWRPARDAAAEDVLDDVRGLAVTTDAEGTQLAFVLTEDGLVRLALD